MSDKSTLLQTTKEEISSIIYDYISSLNGFQVYDLTLYITYNYVKCTLLLDKISNPYGSPTISECQNTLKNIKLLLVPTLCKQGIENIFSIEVSSPGAERVLKSVDDYIRFQKISYKVIYELESDTDKKTKKLLTDYLYYVKMEGDNLFWCVANVKKHKKKSKNIENKTIIIPKDNILKVSLHIDV